MQADAPWLSILVPVHNVQPYLHECLASVVEQLGADDGVQILALDDLPRFARMQVIASMQPTHATSDMPWAQDRVAQEAMRGYELALEKGIAKEQARALLPEGLTPSRLYMNGTMRSWVHYLGQRLHPSTQKEHRLIAEQALTVLRGVAPITMTAFFPEGARHAT